MCGLRRHEPLVPFEWTAGALSVPGLSRCVWPHQSDCALPSHATLLGPHYHQQIVMLVRGEVLPGASAVELAS